MFAIGAFSAWDSDGEEINTNESNG